MEDNDPSSNYSSKDDKEANMCFMDGHQSEVTSVSSNISMNHENCSTLLQAFKETHEEANKLTLSNERLKGLNNKLENKINLLEEELQFV